VNLSRSFYIIQVCLHLMTSLMFQDIFKICTGCFSSCLFISALARLRCSCIKVGHEREEVVAENASNERLIREVARMSAREKMDIPLYEGNLDVEELLDSIRALDTYFDYEDVKEDRKVKHVVTRLKGHATLWWDEIQADRCSKGKQKIKSWDRMVAKMKANFIPGITRLLCFRECRI
jgi:hypothetical protein